MDKFKIGGKDLANKDIELEFQYSKGALRESIHNQKNSYEDLGKLLTVLPAVSSNAIALGCHNDRYKGTVREDLKLKQSYVLIGAFSDTANIVPVKLIIKEFKEGNEKNKLHVIITGQKIKSEGVSRELLQSTLPYSTSDLYTINISDLISNINPEDGDLLKYIPDGFLNDAQKQSKDKALKQEDRKLKSIKSKTAKEVESKPKKKSTKKKVAEAKEKILSEYEDILTDDDVDTLDEMFADKDYRKTLKEHKADERHTIEQEYFADLELNEDANTGKVWAGMSKIIDSVVSESNAEQEATGKPQTRENDEGKENRSGSLKRLLKRAKALRHCMRMRGMNLLPHCQNCLQVMRFQI